MSGTATFLSALLIGLLGAGHCVGMCGGISGMLSVGTERFGVPPRLLRICAYNSGRIVSYTAAGAVAGFASHTLGDLLPPGVARQLAMAISAVFALLLALYMIGWGNTLIRLERLGGGLWQRLGPLAQRLLPARNAGHALVLGLVWGWLPCGLVYTALAWALASGSAARGALLMLGFGLGTLPALMTMGMAGSWLLAWRNQPLVRYAAGVVLVGFAASALWHGFGPADSSMAPMH